MDKKLHTTLVIILVVLLSVTTVPTVFSDDGTFDPAGSPTVTTENATGVGGYNATLQGTLTNDGGEGCTLGFDYGLDTSYGNNVTALPTYVYVGGATNLTVWQVWQSNMTKKANTTSFGGIIYAIAEDDTYIYAGGATNLTVKQYYKSNMTLKANTISYGGVIYALAQDTDYVYAGGVATPSNSSNVTQYYKSNMTKKANTTTAYGGDIRAIAQDSEYIYVVGLLTNKVRQYWKSNMTKKAETALIGSAGSALYGLIVDDNYIYVGGETNTVGQYYKSNMTFKANASISYGDIVYGVAQDDIYVYDTGASQTTVKQYWKSNMTYKAKTPVYGGAASRSLAVDSTYIYVAESTGNTVKQYNKNTMTLKASSASYGGLIYAISSLTDKYTTGYAFSFNSTGLTPLTTYHYRAYAINSAGKSVGDDKTFTTTLTTPIVTTNSATGIASTNATLQGILTQDGGESCTVRFEYGLNVTYGTNSTNQIASAGSAFSFNATGLIPLTIYHYRTYANNSAGGSLGDDKNFTTLNPPLVYVDDNATPSWYDCAHVKTIQEGVTNVSDGGTIYVYGGTYPEALVSSSYITIASKNLTIIGEQADMPKIRPLMSNSSAQNVFLFSGSGYSLTLQYLDISNYWGGNTTPVHLGVSVTAQNNLTVDHCIIHDVSQCAKTYGNVTWTNTTSYNFHYRVLEGSGSVAYALQFICKYNIIYDGTFENSGEAIKPKYPNKYGEISYNYICGNRIAIWVDPEPGVVCQYGGNWTISHNTIDNRYTPTSPGNVSQGISLASVTGNFDKIHIRDNIINGANYYSINHGYATGDPFTTHVDVRNNLFNNSYWEWWPYALNYGQKYFQWNGTGFSAGTNYTISDPHTYIGWDNTTTTGYLFDISNCIVGSDPKFNLTGAPGPAYWGLKYGSPALNMATDGTNIGAWQGSPASPNQPPIISNETPVNSSIGNSISLIWNVTIQDPDGNLLNWTIQCNNGQNSSVNGASNGTKTLSISGLSYLTAYTVWVNVTDGIDWARNWYIFTTSAGPSMIISNEFPPNSFQNARTTETNITVRVNNVNAWSIETLPNVGSSSGNASGLNTVLSCPINLYYRYNNSVTWWLNVTDTNSTSASFTYNFTTNDGTGIFVLDMENNISLDIGSLEGKPTLTYDDNHLVLVSDKRLRLMDISNYSVSLLDSYDISTYGTIVNINCVQDYIFCTFYNTTTSTSYILAFSYDASHLNKTSEYSTIDYKILTSCTKENYIHVSTSNIAGDGDYYLRAYYFNGTDFVSKDNESNIYKWTNTYERADGLGRIWLSNGTTLGVYWFNTTTEQYSPLLATTNSTATSFVRVGTQFTKEEDFTVAIDADGAKADAYYFRGTPRDGPNEFIYIFPFMFPDGIHAKDVIPVGRDIIVSYGKLSEIGNETGYMTARVLGTESISRKYIDLSSDLGQYALIGSTLQIVSIVMNRTSPDKYYIQLLGDEIHEAESPTVNLEFAGDPNNQIATWNGVNRYINGSLNPEDFCNITAQITVPNDRRIGYYPRAESFNVFIDSANNSEQAYENCKQQYMIAEQSMCYFTGEYSQITAYLIGHGSYTPYVSYAIYSDVNDTPGICLGYTDAQRPGDQNLTGGYMYYPVSTRIWYAANITYDGNGNPARGINLAEGQTYWLVTSTNDSDIYNWSQDSYWMIGTTLYSPKVKMLSYNVPYSAGKMTYPTNVSDDSWYYNTQANHVMIYASALKANNPAITNVSIGSATLTWYNGSSTTNYPMTTFSHGNNTNDWTYNVTGLSAGNWYSFDISAIDEFGNWIGSFNQFRFLHPGLTERIWFQCGINPDLSSANASTDLYSSNYILYLNNASYAPTPDPGWYGDNEQSENILQHEQGIDGGVADTGYWQNNLPTDTIQERHCQQFVGAWWNKDVTINGTIPLNNAYYHLWTGGGPDWNQMLINYGRTNSIFDYSWNERAGYPVGTIAVDVNASTKEKMAGIGYLPSNYADGKYHLLTGDINLTGLDGNNTFDSDSIYKFFFDIDYNGSFDWGQNAILLNNRSYMSYIIFNRPDNDTLKTMDSDHDGVNDYEELFVNGTCPFVADTDGDGFNDSVDEAPNNYHGSDLFGLYDVYPVNGSENVTLQPTCSATVYDGGSYTVTFTSNYTGTWVDYQTNISVSGDDPVYWNFTGADENSTTYWWTVYYDNGITNLSQTYHFTTVRQQKMDILLNRYFWGPSCNVQGNEATSTSWGRLTNNGTFTANVTIQGTNTENWSLSPWSDNNQVHLQYVTKPYHPQYGAIYDVTLCALVKKDPGVSDPNFFFRIETYWNYEQTSALPLDGTNWTNVSYTFTEAPPGGRPWTWMDVQQLAAGFIANGGGWGSGQYVEVTQFYIVVHQSLGNITLRPNSDVSNYRDWQTSTSDYDHYPLINEIVPDYDATLVYTEGTYASDAYRFPALMGLDVNRTYVAGIDSKDVGGANDWTTAIAGGHYAAVNENYPDNEFMYLHGENSTEWFEFPIQYDGGYWDIIRSLTVWTVGKSGTIRIELINKTTKVVTEGANMTMTDDWSQYGWAPACPAGGDWTWSNINDYWFGFNFTGDVTQIYFIQDYTDEGLPPTTYLPINDTNGSGGYNNGEIKSEHWYPITINDYNTSYLFNNETQTKTEVFQMYSLNSELDQYGFGEIYNITLYAVARTDDTGELVFTAVDGANQENSSSIPLTSSWETYQCVFDKAPDGNAWTWEQLGHSSPGTMFSGIMNNNGTAAVTYFYYVVFYRTNELVYTDLTTDPVPFGALSVGGSQNFGLVVNMPWSSDFWTDQHLTITFAADNATQILNVTLYPTAIIDISVSQSDWSQNISMGGNASTDVNWAYIQNNGNCHVYVSIAATNTSNWTLEPTLGIDQFALQWYGSKQISPQWPSIEKIAVDDSGNIYATGSFYGYADFGNGITLSESDVHANGFLVKYDSAGVAQWAVPMTGSDAVDSTNMFIYNDDIYVTGSHSADVDFGNGITIGDSGIFIAKYDFNGTAQLATSTSGSNPVYTTNIVVDNNGIYICGFILSTSNESVAVDFGNGITLGVITGVSTFITKYDATGGALWAVEVNESALSDRFGFALDKDGNIYFSGVYNKDITFGNGVCLNDSGLYIVEYNSSGIAQMAINSSSANGMGRGIVVDNDGNIYWTGDMYVDMNFGNITAYYGNGSTASMFLAKYIPGYGFDWVKIGTTDGSDAVTPYEILLLNNNIYVTGNHGWGNIDFGNGITLGADRDTFTIKYDLDGVPSWITYNGGISLASCENNIYTSGNQWGQSTIYFNSDFTSISTSPTLFIDYFQPLTQQYFGLKAFMPSVSTSGDAQTSIITFTATVD